MRLMPPAAPAPDIPDGLHATPAWPVFALPGNAGAHGRMPVGHPNACP
ncbi:hypothetical protein LHGZ1_1105 [Laribacter hongkongensis]|uniref:Uncharacterized protein n=1 Tax=Laribacter hongkongensis TaxID=168471 RepID=A0A248LHS0_9NEIS|nr:hypothetical protein LHGZ1_1105 [Laribacter hongkongensis]